MLCPIQRNNQQLNLLLPTSRSQEQDPLWSHRCRCHLSWSPLLSMYLLLQKSALRDAISFPGDADPTCYCSLLEVTKKNNPDILNVLLRSSLQKLDPCREITKSMHSLTHALGAQDHHARVGFGGFNHKAATATTSILGSASISKNSHLWR